ncbi:hypothetical protein Hte_011223 [Hypoxylon texense]
MSSIHYKSRMLNLKERLEISDNSWTMLKAYDDYKTSRIDEGELGRKVRLSLNSRSSMMDTLLQCVQIMNDKPDERKHCLDIIAALGEMIKMRDQPAETLSFLFMKLPEELRRMCYNLYIDGVMKNRQSTSVVPKGERNRDGCTCVPYPPRDCHDLELHLAQTCKQVQKEFMTVFYQRFTISFRCACQMGYHLENNALLKSEVRQISFHWAGPNAHADISLLHKMDLQSLKITISKETGKYLTEKEEEFRRYFRPKKGYHNCLTETLGIEELMKLRGLKVVQVLHAPRTTSQLRTDAERHALESLLRDKVLRSRDEDADNQ